MQRVAQTGIRIILVQGVERTVGFGPRTFCLRNSQWTRDVAGAGRYSVSELRSGEASVIR